MYGVLTRRSSIVRFTTLFVEKKRDFDWYSWKCSSAFYASSQHFHSFTFIGRPLEKHAIFAHVLVCIIYVVAEPRRFLAILLIETKLRSEENCSVFPPYLKVVVACFVCVVERVGWTHLFGAFFYRHHHCLKCIILAILCARRDFWWFTYYLHVLGGAHKPLKDMLHLTTYSRTFPNHCTWAVYLSF